jgi:hypothetical protein
MKYILQRLILPFYPPVFIYCIHLIIHVYNLYYVYENLDMIMHFSGGFAVAWSVSIFVSYFEKNIFISSVFLRFLLLISLTLLVGVLWECYEYLHDVWFSSQYLGNVQDTLSDLLLDMCGAGVYGISIFFLKKGIFGKAIEK